MATADAYAERRPILRELLVSTMVQWLLLVSSLVSLLPCSSWVALELRSPQQFQVAHECIRRRWHDALRQLRNPAEFTALRVLPHGLCSCNLSAFHRLSGPALLLLALIGFGIAFWDYQLEPR